jgi:hypothetical protein
MTRDALDAALAERYGPPVRQLHGVDGPAARWREREAVLSEIRRLYFDEHLPTATVAAQLGVPWHEVVGVVQGWTT